MTSQRKDVKQRAGSICSQKRMTDKFLHPASYILKSRDSTDDLKIALPGKVPIKTISSEILKIDKSEKQLGSSKILHCPSSKNFLRAAFCVDKSPKQPMAFIECMTTPKGPLARIIQCSKTSKDRETKLKKGSSYRIIQLVTDPAERAIPDQKARVSSGRALSERSVSCRKSKPEVTYRSPPDCKLARPDRADLKIDISLFPKMKDPLSQVTRKEGLDPSEISYSLKKSSSRYKRRIYPVSYCQPVRRSATKDICSDFLHTKSSAPDAKSSPIEVRMTLSARSDKASVCQKSTIPFRQASLIPERISGDTLRLPSSQELLARYKKYIPAYQLERYEACRSKRNGLQDECIPPLLRAILKKEEQQRTLDKCIKRERNVDQLGQNGTNESMSQTKILLYMK